MEISYVDVDWGPGSQTEELFSFSLKERSPEHLCSDTGSGLNFSIYNIDDYCLYQKNSQGPLNSLGNEFGDFSLESRMFFPPSSKGAAGRALRTLCSSPIRTNDLEQGSANCGP